MRAGLKGLVVLSGAAALLFTSVAPAAAIPAFARRYRVTCSLCHAPAPRLTEFGEAFAGNGFQMAPGEVPTDTINTGDPLLVLAESLPLAVRLDLFAQVVTGSDDLDARADFQTPYGVKLLSGMPIAKNVSYYLYFFMSERGAVAGLEDAYIQFTDLFGSGVALIVGQFQLSDPLFKRELRLEYEDYNVYRVRVGDTRLDLTYDRGLMAFASPWEGGDVTLQLVNGRGIDEAGENRLFDGDAFKTVAGRVSQSLGPLRVGGYALYGPEDRGDLSNEVVVWGPDLTLTAGQLELNGQFLRRTDTRPFFLDSDEETTVDAVLGELVWGPQGPTGRWFLMGLYNRVWADDPIFTVRQGEDGLLDRYETAALGATWLLARNVRILGETQWDFERERARITLGVVSAF
ncbi:MAG TPA: hypothetical protein VFU06_03335 [Longimicrobiales bacterium]|nr:hypothetical protein [Longimicrobiales bacterium]